MIGSTWVEYKQSFARHLQIMKGTLADYNVPDDQDDLSPGTFGDGVVASSIRKDATKPWQPPTHAVVLDLNVPAMLVPSTTPGHSHLYIDVNASSDAYLRLLRALAECGVIEKRYWAHSVRKGFTSVRLPWVKKPRFPDCERPL